MDKFTVERRDKWLTKNADIVKLLEKNGFYAKIDEITTNLLFFIKELDFPFSLGDDITDETLSLDSHSNYNRMKDLYEKYRVSIGLPDFYQKRIVREHSIFIDYCIRLNIGRKRSYSDPAEMTVTAIRKDLKSKELSNVLDGIDYKNKGRDSENYLREKEYKTEITLESIKTTIRFAQDKMTAISKVIKAHIPDIIEEMRVKVEGDYKEYEQAIVSMKLRAFLDGALLQFEALNKVGIKL